MTKEIFSQEQILKQVREFLLRNKEWIISELIAVSGSAIVDELRLPSIAQSPGESRPAEATQQDSVVEISSSSGQSAQQNATEVVTLTSSGVRQLDAREAKSP